MPFNPPIQAGMEPHPGYRVTRFLGRGGFSEVWEAEAPDGARVALKLMSSADGRVAPREIRSMQMVRKLQHPSLVRVDSVSLYRQYIVIAMELAEGGLNDLLEAYQTELGTPIPPEQVCLYFAQAADVLDFLNARRHRIGTQVVGVQHCDVKPSNLLLCGDLVKLSDFGLASPITGPTNAHNPVGTAAYAAPEVFKGRLSDRTDQYALAVSYCELRGGRLPFTDAPAHFDRQYTRPAADLSMLPAAERPVVARALSAAPPDRWPSCVEFISHLTASLP